MVDALNVIYTQNFLRMELRAKERILFAFHRCNESLTFLVSRSRCRPEHTAQAGIVNEALDGQAPLVVIESHRLFFKVCRIVPKLREHLSHGDWVIDEEVQGQRLLIRDDCEQRIATVARIPGHVLVTLTSPPERVKITLIILCFDMLVDSATKFEVVAVTTKQKHAVELG